RLHRFHRFCGIHYREIHYQEIHYQEIQRIPCVTFEEIATLRSVRDCTNCFAKACPNRHISSPCHFCVARRMVLSWPWPNLSVPLGIRKPTRLLEPRWRSTAFSGAG